MPAGGAAMVVALDPMLATPVGEEPPHADAATARATSTESAPSAGRTRAGVCRHSVTGQ